MSGAASSVPAGAPTPFGRLVRGRERARGRGRRAELETAIELTIFACFAVGALALWARLLVAPPLGRLALATLICLAGAVGLAALRARRPRRAPRVAAWALGIGVLGLAAAAAGVPVRLLWIGNWAELIDVITAGLAGLEDVDLPYGGGDRWLRLTIAVSAPALLAVAAGLAFAPARRPQLRRVLALVVLLACWGFPLTLHPPPAELVWGVPLFALTGAWLWAPALGRGQARAAAAVALVTGLAALPVAAALDPERPWWDYESWNWFGRATAASYEWDHSYGPLDWPRRGATMLRVRSAQPLYWKATVLDRFNGFTWERATPGDPLADPELAARANLPGERLPNRNRDWLTRVRVEVRGLRSEFVIGAGTVRDVDRLDDPIASPDGTLTLLDDTLEPGDSYELVTYAPRPDQERMRAAPQRYPPALRGSTLVALPSDAPGAPPPPGKSATAGGPGLGTAISFGLWNDPNPRATDAVLASPYADAYHLARRITAGAPTAYDAANRVEQYLRSNFDYTPEVPEHQYPLHAFLFEDRAGYCQQFSGAMALMLRMIGIPARVVGGFAPGTVDPERNLYTVRDLDAHSWVEVFFPGIGWVTFDPTPGSAPASLQSFGGTASSIIGGGTSVVPDQSTGRAAELERDAGGGSVAAGGRDRAAAVGPIALAATAVLVAAGLVLGAAALRRRRRLLADQTPDARIAELVAALGRLGWPLEPGTTLFAIERRFERSGRRAVARYAAALRAHRYAGKRSALPGPAERRRLRAALAAGGGLRRRLAALRAIPPGGPAARRRELNASAAASGP